MSVETIYMIFIGLCTLFGLLFGIAILWDPDKREEK